MSAAETCLQLALFRSRQGSRLEGAALHGSHRDVRNKGAGTKRGIGNQPHVESGLHIRRIEALYFGSESKLRGSDAYGFQQRPDGDLTRVPREIVDAMIACIE